MDHTVLNVPFVSFLEQFLKGVLNVWYLAFVYVLVETGVFEL